LAYKTELATWGQALEKASSLMVWTAVHFVVAQLAMYTSDQSINTWQGVYTCIALLALASEVFFMLVLQPILGSQATAFYRLLAWEWLEEAGVYTHPEDVTEYPFAIPVVGIHKTTWKDWVGSSRPA